MKCLVTGGAGFIGSHLTEELLHRGHEVRVLDNLLTGYTKNLAHFKDNPMFEFIEGSVTDADVVDDATQNIDVIFHHAARVSVPESLEKPAQYHETNATGTLVLLEAARRNHVKKFINVSSSAVYGDTETFPISEKNPIQPHSTYAITKYLQEHYCKMYSKHFGLQTASFRYFNVYGPRQDPKSAYAAAIPKFFLKIQEGNAPVIFGDGKQTRDFVYVKDVVSANIKAMEKDGLAGEVFNISGGQRINIHELATKILKMTGTSGEPEFSAKRPGDIVHSYADISYAKSELGWIPEWNLDEGLKATKEWFQAVYNS